MELLVAAVLLVATDLRGAALADRLDVDRIRVDRAIVRVVRGKMLLAQANAIQLLIVAPNWQWICPAFCIDYLTLVFLFLPVLPVVLTFADTLVFADDLL